MFGLGMPEIIVILVIALIIFGPNKLPEVARSIGKGMQEFRNMTMGVERTMQEEFDAIMKDGDEAPGAETADAKEKETEVAVTEKAVKFPGEEEAQAGETPAEKQEEKAEPLTQEEKAKPEEA